MKKESRSSQASKCARRCAASRRRTIATVRRSVASWCRIYDSYIEFKPQSGDCASLAREVKEFLAGSCPVASEEARMSFQSIKKLLPASCACMDGSMLERLISGMLIPRDQKLPSGYLKYARKVARELFPPAWDTTYREHVFTTGPTLKSTFELTRANGGGSSFEIGQDKFMSIAFGLEECPQEHVSEPMVVQSAGKPRPLTKYQNDSLLMKPLHKAMYDQLSSFSWLLRGDISPSALDKAGFKKGRGKLVSGDYKSATDNLPLCVAEAILDVALENASRVPESVRTSARNLLRPKIYRVERNRDGTVLSIDFLGDVVAGQQMGSLLSFPLLCVQNYISFRWACYRYFGHLSGGALPILINGDDILFQVDDPDFFRFWVQTVQQVGLEVELSKTSFELDFGSLNSTLLRWSGSYLRVVRTARMGMLRSADFYNSLSSNFKNFTCGLGSRAFEAARQFFLWNRQAILRTGRTLRELGFQGALAWRVANKMKLQRVALREVFKLGSLPPAPSFHNFVLSKQLVQQVPAEFVNREDGKISSREMTSWKWSLCGQFKKSGTIMSYLAALSRPGLVWASLSFLERTSRFNPHLTETPRMDVEEQLYFSVRPAHVKTRPIFRSIDRLPAYAEVVEDATPMVPYVRYRMAGIDKWVGGDTK